MAQNEQISIILGLAIPVGLLFVFILFKSHDFFQNHKISTVFKKTVPGFNYKIRSLDRYPYSTLIYVNKIPVFFELTNGVLSNGLYGYGKMVLTGIGESSEIKFKLGTNVFAFYTAFKTLTDLLRENGIQLEANYALAGKLKELEKEMNRLNNLKVVEASADESSK